RVAVLWNPDYPPSGRELREIEEAAHSLSREVIPAEVRGSEGLEPAFRKIAKHGAEALIVVAAPTFGQRPQQMADLAYKAQLPTMFFNKQFVNAGGLMSYGVDSADTIRRAAAYVDKILKGAKPADLPVEQPTKFELFINLKTAKALGLSLPYTLLGLAD